MGITPRFTQGEIHKVMQQSLARLDKVLINMLADLGEKCVNEARDSGSYEDQTSNLRSSIGYIILADGEVVRSDFRKSGIVRKPEKGDGTEGLETARSFAMSLAGNYPRGFVLIVVAGMNYAAYVETSRNVLSTAEHLAQTQMPRILAELKAKVGRMA